MIVDVIIGVVVVGLVFGGLVWKMIQEDKERYNN
jgi:predicted alternative tryptophan synthase beta-subunit